MSARCRPRPARSARHRAALDPRSARSDEQPQSAHLDLRSRSTSRGGIARLSSFPELHDLQQSRLLIGDQRPVGRRVLARRRELFEFGQRALLDRRVTASSCGDRRQIRAGEGDPGKFLAPASADRFSRRKCAGRRGALLGRRGARARAGLRRRARGHAGRTRRGTSHRATRRDRARRARGRAARAAAAPRREDDRAPERERRRDPSSEIPSNQTARNIARLPTPVKQLTVRKASSRANPAPRRHATARRPRTAPARRPAQPRR